MVLEVRLNPGCTSELVLIGRSSSRVNRYSDEMVREEERGDKKRFFGGHGVYIPRDLIGLMPRTMPQVIQLYSTNFCSTSSSLLKYACWREQRADVSIGVGVKEEAKGVAGVCIHIITSSRRSAQ